MGFFEWKDVDLLDPLYGIKGVFSSLVESWAWIVFVQTKKLLGLGLGILGLIFKRERR